MMEAEIFQEISNALKENNNQILLPVENASPIQKIIWSSFDYMAGPELRFVWTADNSKIALSNSTVNKNKLETEIDQVENESETVDGCVSSSDSSFSKNTGGSSTTRDQFEDIDAYNSELLQLSSEKFENVEINSNWNLNNLTPNTSNSQTNSTLFMSSNQRTTKSIDFKIKQQNFLSSTKEKISAFEAEESENINEMIGGDTMVQSCVDSGIAGTISMDSNLSSFATQESSKEKVIFNANNEFCKIKLTKKEDYRNIHEAEEVIEFDHDAYSYSAEDAHGCEEIERIPKGGGGRNSLMSSQFESFYSNCTNNSQFDGQSFSTNEKSILYKEAELLAMELSSIDGNTLTDQEFVAKQVLAEQIGSIQLTTNPLLHKFCIIPSRHIAFGSFIFSTREADQPISAAPNLSAFSILIPIQKAEWYLERQFVFQEIFSDIISKFKAAHLVESFEDLICRLTKEFSHLFTLFGAIERWPLTNPEIQRIRIQSSHLWELRKDNGESREFLIRCITASLICRGRCTIIGSNRKEVMRLIMTLNAFIEPKDRIFCLKPHKLQFSPYLRLQAIKRSETFQFFEQAANAHWPCSLLDIDRKSVIYTGLYHKHRAQKKAAQIMQISQIFREAMDSGLDVPANILIALDQQQILNETKTTFLETHNVRPDPAVYEFMDQICFLPLNRAARISFIDHFHLRMENHSKSLITFIRDLSLPSPNDKRSSLSSKWHLATVRRNLNMQPDSTFGIALAKAESLQPDFAEFIIQQTTSIGRNINQ